MSYDPYPIRGSHAPEAIEFGRIITDGRKEGRLRYGDGNHVLIFGKSGSGKDTRILIPNLLRMHGNRSVVCVDPKGEMAAVTAKHRAKFGRVVILNPFGVLTEYQGYEFMAGGGFNPLAALDPWSDEFNVDAGLMAEALIPMSPNERNPFFPLSARALVGGLIMYEVCKAKEQGRVPLLANVRRMICEAAQKAEPPSKALPYGIPAKGIPAYALEMADSIILGMRNKGGQFVDWNKSSEDVAKTAMSETEFLDDLPMALNLARNDFDFKEMKERPTTVYLVLPMKVMQRHRKWLRMLLTAALQACMRPRAQNEPSILFIMNEFAALGHLQLIEDNFTVVRGAGIQMMPVLQDLNQLKQLYDKRWETFIGNADVIAAFAPNDITTAEWFSKRCGETARPKVAVTENWGQNSGTSQNQGTSPTGETMGSGTSGGWSFSRNANHSLEKVPFVSPSDLYRMEPGEMRIIAAGEADTIHAHALPYWAMKNTIAGLAFPNPYAPDAKLIRIPRAPAGGQFTGFFQKSRENNFASSAYSNYLPDDKPSAPFGEPGGSPGSTAAQAASGNSDPFIEWYGNNGGGFQAPPAAQSQTLSDGFSGWDVTPEDIARRYREVFGTEAEPEKPDEPPEIAPDKGNDGWGRTAATNEELFKYFGVNNYDELSRALGESDKPDHGEGDGKAPSPTPPQRAAEPEKPLSKRVAAKHPGYAPEPPRKLPAPPTIGQQDEPYDEDADAADYDDDD